MTVLYKILRIRNPLILLGLRYFYKNISTHPLTVLTILYKTKIETEK